MGVEANASSEHTWGRRRPGNLKSLSICHFDIVDGCQLSCVGCPVTVLRPRVTRIALDDFATCLSNIDVKYITLFRLFNFGEPLLHSELPSLLSLLPKQAWRAQTVEISTNAQNVDWNMLAEAIRMRVLNRLVVSCDGDGTPAEYERLRPPASWSKLVEFLKRAKELRSAHDPKLILMTRTICSTDEGRARWRAFLEPLGWEPEFRGWLGLPEAPNQFVDSKPGTGVCALVRHHETLYVNANGDVVPCCYHPKAAVWGNLKTQTANQILAGKTRTEFAQRLEANRASMPVCGNCHT